MKNWIILTMIILLNQFLTPYFELQIVFFICSGFIIIWFRNVKKMFLKSFVIQVFVSLLVYMQFSDGVNVLEGILLSIDLPEILLPISFVLINALTTAFSFQIGCSIKALIKRSE